MCYGWNWLVLVLFCCSSSKDLCGKCLTGGFLDMNEACFALGFVLHPNLNIHLSCKFLVPKQLPLVEDFVCPVMYVLFITALRCSILYTVNILHALYSS